MPRVGLELVWRQLLLRRGLIERFPGIGDPHPQKLVAARLPLPPRPIFMIILPWSDRAFPIAFRSGLGSPDDVSFPPSDHIVWGDEAKPPVLTYL